MRKQSLALRLLGGWIFAGGVGTLLLCLALCRVHYPEDFIDDWPTLSEAGSVSPGDHIFTVGMASVGLAIMLFWSLACSINARAVQKRPALLWLTALTLLLGLIEGVSVAGLGLFRLHVQTDLHMAASYGTFFGGCLAFLADSLGATRWQTDAGRKRRIALATATAATGLFFFAMFLTKGGNPLGSYMATRIAYCGGEFLLAVLSFGYAPLYGFELAKNANSRS